MSRKTSPEDQSGESAPKKEKPLSARKIEKFLAKSKTFLGTIYLSSFNQLLVKAKTFSLIVHCSNHWFCIFSTEKSFEIFDPLGFLQKAKCFNEAFLNFVKTHIGRKVLYANPKIQSDSSNACGYFVCFFLINRELGLSFNEILSKFTKNYRKNQTLVKLYLNKMRE